MGESSFNGGRKSNIFDLELLQSERSERDESTAEQPSSQRARSRRKRSGITIEKSFSPQLENFQIEL